MIGADVCLAVTGVDEVNLVAASIAKSMGCRRSVARTFGPIFRNRSTFDYERHFNIDRLRVVDDVDGMDREWIEAWAKAAEAEGAVVPFEALYDLERQDLPMLDVRDSL